MKWPPNAWELIAPILGASALCAFGLGFLWFLMTSTHPPAPPPVCDICGNYLKSVSSQWTLEGEVNQVCPHCNRHLESRNSSVAVKRRFGRARR